MSHHDDRPASGRNPVDALLEAWDNYPPVPRFEDFLNDPDFTTETLAALIRTDAQQRLQHREPIELDFYRGCLGTMEHARHEWFAPGSTLTQLALGFEHLAGNDPKAALERLGPIYDSDIRTAFGIETNSGAQTIPPTEAGSSEHVGGSAAQASTWAKGDRIGAFTLRKQIGSGGFGEVWLASRAKPQLDVAVKVLRADATDSSSIKRFEAEAQALAFLEHCYIAKIIDAGTVRGMPYLVMEYVEGKTLTQYCDDHRLSIPQRLELMARVCEGVQHAHLRGLIHRDLKPDNILVTEITKHPKDLDEHEGPLIVRQTDGRVTVAVPKIVDFGLAKASEKSLRLADGTLTVDLGKMMGTPEYMSPEQAGHQPLEVTQQADVFSLGVILYELLTGTLPLTKSELQARMLDEMVAMLRGTPRPDLSTRLSSMDADTVRRHSYHRGEMSTRELEQRLRSRVRHLCGKALRLEPERRFSSSAAMAQDIRNYLADRDFVEAAAEPARDKVLRSIRRHKPMYAAGLLIVVFLVLSVASSVYGIINAKEADTQQARADAADAIAESQAERVRDLIDVLLVEVHDAVQRLPGGIEAREIILKAVSSSLEEISQEEGADDPRVLVQFARAYDRVGDLLGGVRGAALGKVDEALRQYLEARRIRDNLDDETRRGIILDIAINHRKVGDVWLRKGDIEQAAIEYQQAADLVEGLRAASSLEELELERQVMIALNERARLQSKAGDTSAALDTNRRSLEIAERLVAAAPEDLRYLRDLGLAHSYVGERLRALDDSDGALEHHKKALALRTNLFERDPLNRTFRRDLGLTNRYLGHIYLDQGAFDLALDHAENSAIIASKLALEDPDVARTSTEYIDSFSYLLQPILDASDNLNRAEEAVQRLESQLIGSLRENDLTSVRIRVLIAGLKAKITARRKSYPPS